MEVSHNEISSSYSTTIDEEGDNTTIQAENRDSNSASSDRLLDQDQLVAPNQKTQQLFIAVKQVQTNFKEKPAWRYALGTVVCILAHVLSGLSPIFSRYLQYETTPHVPTLGLIVISHLFILGLYSPRLLYLLVRRVIRKWRGDDAYYDVNPTHVTSSLRFVSPSVVINSLIRRYWIVILFIIARVVRSSTSLLSTRFAKAVNVQLLNQFTPFIVSAMSLLVANRYLPENQREKFSWKSVAAIVFTVAGGLFIIAGGAVEESKNEYWYSFLITVNIDWAYLGSNLDFYHKLGLGLAFIASVCLGIYMLTMKFISNEHPEISEEHMFVFEEVAIVLTFIVPSLVIDDWTVFGRLHWKQYIILCVFSLVVNCLASFLLSFAVHEIGPGASSSMLSMRLLSTIAFSGIFLDEWFASLWQLLGTIIVFIATTYYIYNQTRSVHEEYVRQNNNSDHGPGEESPLEGNLEMASPIELDDSTDIEINEELVIQKEDEHVVDESKTEHFQDIVP